MHLQDSVAILAQGCTGMGADGEPGLRGDGGAGSRCSVSVSAVR